MPDRDDIVHVQTSDRMALERPSFIIAQDGRYYAAVAVLEYDPDARGITDEQRRGVDQVRKLFESAPEGTRGEAVMLEERWGWAAMNTIPKPPRPKRRPGPEKPPK